MEIGRESDDDVAFKGHESTTFVHLMRSRSQIGEWGLVSPFASLFFSSIVMGNLFSTHFTSHTFSSFQSFPIFSASHALARNT